MGIHYFKIIDRKKWPQKKLLHSQQLNTTNSAAHTPLSCSTTMASRSPLRNSPPSLRPQETLLSHTGPCSSPRHSRPPMLVTSSPRLLPPVQPPLVAVPLLHQLKKRRKKPLRKSIWVDSS